MHLSEFVKHKRHSVRLTQPELAEKAGVGLRFVRELGQGKTTLRMDKENRHITLAYFEQRSTVDYIGAVQGIPVCFDAKECSVDTFPLSNIHPHQVEFMNAFEQQGGIAFFLIFFSHADLFYYLLLMACIRNK